MRAAAALVLLGLALAAPRPAPAYPLDAARTTGIWRLEGYRLAQEGLVRARILPLGAQWPSDRIRLGLADRPPQPLPAPDPELSRSLVALLGGDARGYGIALVDLTNPDAPRYAAHRDDVLQNPGSVGKLLVLLGWFQALADRFPDDVEARARLLRDTQITADAWIQFDSHTVPFFAPGDEAVTRRPIAIGDRANLYTFLDWMCSASSNAAAGELQKELILFRAFGERYPVSDTEEAAFWARTPPAERQRMFVEAIQAPVERNGLDLAALRQGSFFTRYGKAHVPGTTSHASARELARYAFLMEQGRLVDPWSSLEMKKLLYLTEGRIRYASHPALFDAAVFFKSGSLYSCQPEPGYQCGKYLGNRVNYMNSVAIVETEPQQGGLHYIVIVLSNVLRKNSAVAHQTLAMRIHRMLEKRHRDRFPSDQPPPGLPPVLEPLTPDTAAPGAGTDGAADDTPGEELDPSDAP